MIFFNRNKILTILFAIVLLAGLSFFPAKAGAVYEGAGILISQNLLSGLGASRIHSFTYTTTMPAGTGLKIQFSSNNITWYDSAGTVDAWSNLSLGTNVIDLSGLKISSRYFYYKILFISDGTDTAVLDSIKLNYIDDNFTENIYNTSGTLTSTNLLTGQLVKKVTGFTYTATDIPVGTGASAQFSQDNVTWYNSSNVLNGSDTLLAGTNTISLLTLNWTGANFYYRILFTSDGTDTPVLDSITVNFNQPETFYWVGGAGNWSDATNHWATSSGGSPSSENLPTIFDAVIFDGGGVGNCTLDVNAVFASINVTTGYTGTLDFNGKTVTGAVGGDFTFNIGTGGTINMSSSTITVDGNFDVSGAVGTITTETSTLVMTGTGKSLITPYSVAVAYLNKLTIATGSSITIASGSRVVAGGLLTINGSFIINSPYVQIDGGITQGSNGVVSGTGILYATAGNLSLANSPAIAPAEFRITSSVSLPAGVYSPSAVFAIYDYGNYTWAWNAGTYTFTSAVSIVKPVAGTFTISGANNPQLIFQNNITVTQTTGTINFTNNSTNPNQLTGTAAQTINLAGKNMGTWIVNKPTSGAITWTSGDTITAGGNWTSAAALTVPAGVTMDLGDSAYSHSVTGDVILDGAAFDTGNSTLTVGGNYDSLHVTTVTIGSSALVLTGSGKTIKDAYRKVANNLTINAGASISIDASGAQYNTIGMYSTLTVYGTLTIPSSYVFENGGNVYVKTGGRITGAGMLGKYSGYLAEQSGTYDLAYTNLYDGVGLVPGTYGTNLTFY